MNGLMKENHSMDIHMICDYYIQGSQGTIFVSDHYYNLQKAMAQLNQVF